MKLLTPILCAVLLGSCSSPAQRPVTEPIPLDEMNLLLKDKPDYGPVLMLAEKFRTQAGTLEMARANDLTYKALHDFYKSYTNSELHNRLGIQATREWTERFGAAYDRTDSIIDRWKAFLDENKPDSYVRVELQSILPAESSYGSAGVVLRVTPLKGPVDRVEGSFGLFKHGQRHYFGDVGPARGNTFSFTGGLSAPATCRTTMGYSIWDIHDGDIPYTMYPDRPGLPLSELLEKYDFDYTVTTLVREGRQIRFADIYGQIPSPVRNYWQEKDKETYDEYLRGEIVRNLVDSAFTDRSDYVRNYVTDYFRKQDELALWVLSCIQ